MAVALVFGEVDLTQVNQEEIDKEIDRAHKCLDYRDVDDLRNWFDWSAG